MAAYAGRTLAKGLADGVSTIRGWFSDLYNYIAEIPIMGKITAAVLDGFCTLVVKVVSFLFHLISVIGRLILATIDEFHVIINNSDARHRYYRHRLETVANVNPDFFDPEHATAPLITFAKKCEDSAGDVYRAFAMAKDSGTKPKAQFPGNYGPLLKSLRKQSVSAMKKLGQSGIENAFSEEGKPAEPSTATTVIDLQRNGRQVKELKELKDLFDQGEGKGRYDKTNNYQLFWKLWDGNVMASKDKSWNILRLDFILDYGGFLLESMFRFIALLGLVGGLFSFGGGFWVAGAGLIAAELTGLLRNGVHWILALVGTHLQVYGWHNEILFAQVRAYDELILGKKSKYE